MIVDLTALLWSQESPKGFKHHSWEIRKSWYDFSREMFDKSAVYGYDFDYADASKSDAKMLYDYTYCGEWI